MLMLPLLLGLGVWQLDRAQEKAALEASWEARQSQPPSPLDPLWGQAPETLAYLPVLLSGVFLRDQYFLLDNRIYGGTFGYEVLGVIRLTNTGELVLVNRGWAPWGESRDVLEPVCDGRLPR